MSGDRDGDGELDRNEVWLFTSAGVRSFTGARGPASATRHRLGPRRPEPSRCTTTIPPSCSAPSSQVHVEKAVNGDDADAAPGLRRSWPARRITWTYTVTNHGNVAVAVALLDDNGTLSQPAPTTSRRRSSAATPTATGSSTSTEAWLYRATGHRRSSARTATSPWRRPRSPRPGQTDADTDPAHYFSPTAVDPHREGGQRPRPGQPDRHRGRRHRRPAGSSSSARRWCGPTSSTTTGPRPIDVFGVMDDHGTPSDRRRRLRGAGRARRRRLQRRRPQPRQPPRPRRGVALHVGRHRRPTLVALGAVRQHGARSPA